MPFAVKFFIQFLLMFSACRVGEAKHPGPILGTLNPTGLLYKGELLHELPSPALWGVCESHLTNPGLAKFRYELKHSSPDLRFVPGAVAPHLTDNLASIGGKQTGVGFLTQHPVRALTSAWDPEVWSSARVQACACL